MDYPRALLEQLGELQSASWSGRVFRWTFEGTPADRANSRGARWNPPGVEAIYTCLSRPGVLAESDYLIAAQGIAPMRVRQVHTFELSLNSVLEITDMALLERLGVDEIALRSVDQSKCQLVGGAVERLGYDGLIVPSARSSANNLVIFVNNCPLDACFDLIETEIVQASH